MPCRSLVCDRQRDCEDHDCPGHPLHQQDGGHYFHGGVAFPMGDEPQEEPFEGRPIPSVDAAESWPSRFLAVLLLLLAIAALSPFAFF